MEFLSGSFDAFTGVRGKSRNHCQHKKIEVTRRLAGSLKLSLSLRGSHRGIFCESVHGFESLYTQYSSVEHPYYVNFAHKDNTD